MRTSIFMVVILMNLFSRYLFASSLLSECVNNATIECSKGYAGGIAGINMSSIINNCYNRGNITAVSSAGGIVGMAYHPGDVFEFDSENGKITAIKDEYKSLRFVYIPNTIQGKSVKQIADQTDSNQGNFQGNLSIVEVYMGGTSFTHIGHSVFRNCKNLEKVTFPKTSLLGIGNYSFQSCESLKGTLVIPNSVVSMGGSCFNYCSQINKVYISTGLTSIPNSFAYCSSLKELFLLKEVVQKNSIPNMFDSVHPEFKIYVPLSFQNDYKLESSWSAYSSKIFPLP